MSTIVCIGDSLTRGGNWLTKGLCNRLCEKYPSIDIINLGVSGNGTTQMLARYTQADAYRPFRVIIWGGINDVPAGGSIATTIKSNLQTMYSHFDCEVWAVTITPRDDNTAPMVAIRDDVNNWIKGTATNVTRVIDACAIVADPSNPTARLLAYADPNSPNHLNDVGMAAVVAAM